MKARFRLRRALAALALAGYPVVDGEATASRDEHPVLSVTSGAPGPALVAKLYLGGGGRAAFEHMEAAWASSFGERRHPPGLPRPLAFLDDVGAVVMERVDGRSLRELAPMDEPSVVAAVELLADLHASDAKAPEGRSASGVIRAVGREADRLSPLDPGLAASFTSLMEAMQRSHPGHARLVPSHGDFNPRNVLAPTEGMVLIDWDRFRAADPARDLGYFGACCWVRSVREGRDPDWSVLHQASSAYDRLRPAAGVGDRVPFYAAAGLARIGGRLAKRPAQVPLVPRILDEAHRLL